jgi:hypothetical protein
LALRVFCCSSTGACRCSWHQAATAAAGISHLWLGATDHRSAPREIPSSENEDSPFFLPNGDLIFRVGEGNLNFVYRMKQDGTARNKVVADPIFDLKSVPLMAAGW